ncbi:hypothetical protein SNE40_002617 [Patella caerulea]|uniref:phospholipase A2 n=1 Tax=Patella caerulea TaxID=87958 RepID=A0AAN8KG82_PATCE
MFIACNIGEFMYMCMAMICVVTAETMFYRSGDILVETVRSGSTEQCYVYGHSDIIERILEEETSSPVIPITREEILSIINSCTTDIIAPLKFSTTKRYKRQLIYPGTKWCGAGNISSNYSDLGEHAETDSCCREHDYCPDYILPFNTKHGLTNYGLISKSHCDCDNTFYNCLKATTEKAGSEVGYLFFNILEMQCFTVIDAETCLKKGWWFTCNKRGRAKRARFSSNKRF